MILALILFSPAQIFSSVAIILGLKASRDGSLDVPERLCTIQDQTIKERVPYQG
jgi:hypothetical protein